MDVRLGNNTSINSTANDSEVANAIEADGILDDKLLDAVTPRATVLDEVEVEEETTRRAFCTRCRTISSSFLSSSYVSDNYSIGSNEGVGQRNSVSQQLRDPVAGLQTDSRDDADDVPLLRDDDSGEAGQGGLSVSSSQSDHCHTPRQGNRASRKAMTRLIIACCLTTLFMIGEAVGGYLANSIAIMSDAAHLLSDLTSFIVSLVAIFIGMQPASRKMNFGYHRAEVLGAVVSVLMIWLITGILVYAAVERVTSMDFEVESDVMIIVSALGVVINIILGVVLHTGSGGHGHSHGGHGHSHGGSSEQQPASSGTNVNVRAAFIHIIGDLLQSIGVLIAAYIIKFYPEYKIADPICTFIFSVLVIITTIPIMRDLSHVLMEGTPHGTDYATVSNNLMTIQGVKMVHSLHIWALTLDKNACSVHLAISAETDHDTVLRDAQRIIRSRHHIYQTTIQVERYEPLQMDSCQQCQPLSK
ncbi:proton-coupled zinc antiporter SLC30A2-like isoform X1 [Macrobrachium rosenbergii]|uniref:proton-coupled zinc antiporter SLC30A2-like isoform X1 n=1 Tax=Macrobrachium rosenbergii TaxID=79674 RepID=UPI0034D411AC